LDILNHILLDVRNIVYIMSGHTLPEMQIIFERLSRVGLIAENGSVMRCYDSADEIVFPDTHKLNEWKKSVLSILQHYHERITGSSIEERAYGITFHYEDAEDKEAAARQAGDCANHINDACNSLRIRAIPIDQTVVIEPVDWTKATATQRVLDALRKDGPAPDFLFVAGDDREDEVVFKWANKLAQSNVIPNVSTVSLGKRNTEAHATLTQGTSGLLSVLQKLARLR